MTSCIPPTPARRTEPGASGASTSYALSYIRHEGDLAAEAAVVLERGWLTRDAEDRLWLAKVGGTSRNAPAIRADLHEGIGDADCVTTMKVLQRLIRNAGGMVA
ncbi:hypothetical protein ACFWBF_15435 [Streptomyces sp. NPDC060028]|uniref:hypothetical protein n=1 Tax=Streptomyces sp. NPDC060028 TaxID=3347041 RepID=UPI003683E5B4